LPGAESKSTPVETTVTRSDDTTTRRLFFALWPPASIRRQIAGERDAIGPVSRQRVPAHNYHLTLLFLGDQDADQLGNIQSLGDALVGESFELALDRWGFFDQARVAWLGARAPKACLELADALKSGAEALGLEFPTRPFVPHLTVFRRVAPPFSPCRIEPIGWFVRDFSLIESIPHQPYQVLRSWHLE